MKYLVIGLILIFAINLQSEEKTEFMVIGSNYNFSHENDDAYLGFDLQLKEQYKTFVFGVDIGFYFGLESPNDIGLMAFKPSIGFYAYGDRNSTFSVIMSTSVGPLTGEEINKQAVFGTISSLYMDIYYKNFGITIGGFHANTNIYTNRFGQAGLKFKF